jgi:phage tail sheath gpL-like
LGNLVTANFFSGSGNLLSNIQGANVTGAVSSATTAGTVTTAAQPNITSTGTLVSVAVTGNATVGNVKINGGILSNRSNVSVTGTDTIIDQFPTSSFRSAKYYITGKGTNGYQAAEILLVQDGTNSYITIFGSICSNNTTDLLNFSSNIDGVSGNVRVYANTASTSTTVNLVPIYLND